MKVLAIGASNNSKSINRVLAEYSANLIDGAEVEVLNIHDYELPIFSDEREEKFGQPLQARQFFKKIGEADALVISFAEHNGSYTAAWKNLFDWVSRIDGKVFQGKPVVYLSTSPGPGGARSVLASAVESAPFFGAELIDSVSVARFYENFDMEKLQFTNDIVRKQVHEAVAALESFLLGNSRLEDLGNTGGFPLK